MKRSFVRRTRLQAVVAGCICGAVVPLKVLWEGMREYCTAPGATLAVGMKKIEK